MATRKRRSIAHSIINTSHTLGGRAESIVFQYGATTQGMSRSEVGYHFWYSGVLKALY